ncbi:uncharacterized protein KY384_006881 [Bacidia gigantensis]|uniref:uncharacterized protein n=1 Tax=Bacidia gigantensis TaxID=2732470 RepID=UPI001D03ECC6|nr:uncharacterized protein KY384_006881 [Bacidia gigantensis]KAG8527965.1 hypothetical protein KY384_006881 [Bacidia gigantensis]
MSCRTDGVYQDLTNMRVRMPWIQALREQREAAGRPISGQVASGQPSAPDLKPKKMSDSYHKVVRNRILSKKCKLTDTDIDHSSGARPMALRQLFECERSDTNARLGTLFMDLDALSGVIAYKHTGDSVTTVTAAVDRITINHPLKSICDLQLSGQVTYATGRSSMEVSLSVAQAPERGEQTHVEDVLLSCVFTMVSLDPVTKKAVAINPLRPETMEEKRLFEMGERNSNEKKALLKRALKKQTPNDEESDLIHAMWLKQLDYHNQDPNTPTRKPDNLRFMSATVMSSSSIMQPQYRNRHNFMIFGGFLLKQTFELAFCCCAAFTHSRPTFISLDPSTFDNAVPVGSVLYLTATIAYTDQSSIEPSDGVNGKATDEHSDRSTNNSTRVQVRIDSKVRNVEHGETKPTGQFNYTFLVERDIKIMPQTYSEFMIWVDARRRAKNVRACIENTSFSGQTQDDGSGGRIHE